MAKFLTTVQLNGAVMTQFEAESAAEVQQILSEFRSAASEATEAEAAAPAPEKPTRRARKPRTPKDESGVVGHIGVAVVETPAVDPNIPQLTSLAEIADAIRNYARQPGVGVAGVTKLIQEFKNEAGETAKQVKEIAASEFPKVSARLFALSQ